MKRIWSSVLVALLLCVIGTAHAAAQYWVYDGEPDLSHVAVTAGTCDLLEAPQEDADVLMRYYPCVRVEVVDEADAAYVQVSVGDSHSSLTGYMRKEDLIFGEEGMRQVQGYWIEYESRQNCLIYSDCDLLSDVLGSVNDIGLDTEVLGMKETDTDTWLQVLTWDGTFGFVSSVQGGLGAPSIRHAFYSEMRPVEGDLSITEAIAFAKQQILADHESGANLGQGMDDVTAEGLERCQVRYCVFYMYQTERLMYQIDFMEPGSSGYYAWLQIDVQGEEIVGYSYGNG